MKTAWRLLLAFALIPTAFAADPHCAPQFAALAQDAGIGRERLAQVKSELDQDMANTARALQKLELDGSQIEPLGFLGEGFSGSVFRVRYLGKEYALKIFGRYQFREEELPAILIQKRLGELGLAPKVAGVLDEQQSFRFFDRHASSLEDGNIGGAEDARYGLLMELVSGSNFKQDDFKQVPVTAEVKRRLFSDSDILVSTLEELEIHPSDLDIMITQDQQLMLIDLSFFQRIPIKAGPVRRDLRQMLDGLLAVPPER